MPAGAPTMVTPVMGMLVVVVLLAANGPRHCESFEQYEDEDYEDGCHPEEADLCFTDVNDNLMCNLGKPGGRNCTNRDAYDLCQSMNDALECCEDIMDSCTESDGLDIFEVWLDGLRGVYTHLCIEDENMSLISDLLDASKCFRLKKFVSCVEQRADLTHVADLLTTQLDLHECNQLQVTVAACIEDAEKNKAKCRGVAQAVNEALIVFFTTTGCGHAPPPPPTPSPTPCILPPVSGSGQEGTTTAEQHNNNNNNNNSTSTTRNESSSSNNNNSSDSKINTSSNNRTSAINSTDTDRDNTTIIITITTTTTTSSTKENPNSSSSTRDNIIIPNKNSTSNSTKGIPSSTNKPLACQQTQKDLANSGTPTASTVVVTVLVTVVVIGLAAMVMAKRGILTIRTDFDRRLMGLNNEDTNSAYDRF